MDVQDFRSLQEAYLDVYQELDEDAGIVSGLVGLALGAKGALHAAKKTKRIGDYPKNFVKGIVDPRTYFPKKKKTQKEETDLYDIILSHLLDEGYADTEKAALAIMTNMSEEWIKSVYEPEGEVIDELTRYAEKTGKKFTTLRKSVTGGNPEVAARNKLPGYNYGGSRQEPKERGKKPPSPSEEAKKKGLLTPYQHKAALIRNSKGKAKEFKMDTKRT